MNWISCTKHEKRRLRLVFHYIRSIISKVIKRFTLSLQLLLLFLTGPLSGHHRQGGFIRNKDECSQGPRFRSMSPRWKLCGLGPGWRGQIQGELMEQLIKLFKFHRTLSRWWANDKTTYMAATRKLFASRAGPMNYMGISSLDKNVKLWVVNGLYNDRDLYPKWISYAP